MFASRSLRSPRFARNCYSPFIKERVNTSFLSDELSDDDEFYFDDVDSTYHDLAGLSDNESFHFGLPRLSKDLTKLLDNKKNYDFIVNVDKNVNRKAFYLHSIILETRSAYFEDVLSNGLVKKENNTFILDFPDISVNVFNILVRYIYGGTINIRREEATVILNLLIACEKFKLKELCDNVQNYLTVYHHEWILQNIILIQQVSFKYSEFTLLQDYWSTIVGVQPEIVFEATDFTSIDKEVLLSLYRKEDLYIEGCDLWDHIIRWGKAQNTELPEEIKNWTSNDFDNLKKSIDDFIPHIDFYDISSEDFFFKVVPYNTVLSNDLYQDILKYHLVINRKPRFNDLTAINSKLINDEQAMLISSWIQGNKENKISDKFEKVHYEFQLLTRGSRDGFKRETFHAMCDNEGPTITIMKLQNETSILGGYNPINWNINKKGRWERTATSFIFSIDKEIILSRVQVYNKAIYQDVGGPNFNDLMLRGTFNKKHGMHYAKNAYDQAIHDEGNFIVEEYEVFSVIKKR
ncbi:hypothetical protein RclHR1_01480026 [Rhizophagus clarus]|uniref:BTB domain-containing protein n=1 Tax=Rhizophagus clarus TaxID=94130 RepID=A0A2Z6QUD2_9GLOM|nr:hypothetical protein RclHR1_01480026 [Rhizophagus clarus]